MPSGSTARRAIAALSAILVQIVAVQAVWAAPIVGETFRLPQPDGTWIEVRIWGDEFYGVTESLDGYTVVRDPDSRFLCYATLTADGNDLRSTAVPVGSPARDALGLVAHVRINQSAAHAQARATRARWEEEGRLILGGRAAPRAGDRSNVQGICLIVDFSDDVGTIPAATVSNYCNQVGFTGFGDNGSVRDYFFDVSDGALTYTSFVPTAYYRAAHPKGYYTDPNIAYGTRARELIIEALADLDDDGFDFSQYDANGDGVIDAVNCFYAGNVWNDWAEGLWPHAGWVSFCADGVCTRRYQITNMGTALRLRTFCHENGHMLLGWPDLYDYDYDSTGVGRFCLMAYSTSDTNPCEPCAYLKHIAGWSQTILLTVPQARLTVPASSANRFFKFDRSGHPNEYYLIENRQQAGRDAGLPDAGLGIWHIDTLGDNSNNEMTPESHYLVTLVQADGRWDLEHNANYGDATDLWAAPEYTDCTPSTIPDTDWWDGSASGLAITSISASASVMTFDFSASAQGGSIVAWGLTYDGQCNVPAPNTGFVAVAGGSSHSLGLKADGSIVPWGSNDFGECNVPAPNSDFVAVAAIGDDSLGLKGDGSLVAWGSNGHGECDVPAPNSGFVAVAGGLWHSLGLKADGSIVAWGWNDYGQCNVPAPNTGFVAVEGGEVHSLGLKGDGSIVAWGDNWYGQCNVPAPNTGFVAVAGGLSHSLGLKGDGSIVAWGYNDYGQCNVPAPNTGFVAVAGGGGHSLGLNAHTGACCYPDGSCAMMAQADCAGIWHGEWTSCTPNPCPPPTGACCVAGACTLTTAANCSGTWKGAETTCTPNPCLCPGDTNCDGHITSADIDLFVEALAGESAWNQHHSGCPWLNADCNGSGTVTFADIDPFVAVIGTTCP